MAKSTNALAVVPVVMLAALSVALVLFAPSCDGYEDQTIALANACPMATSLLGSPIARVTWGYQPGTKKGKGSSATFVQDVLVKGTQRSGTIEVNARRLDDVWTIRTALLEADGQTIELTRCGTYTSARLFEKRSMTGQVDATTGSAPVQKGEICHFAIKAEDDFVLCRATVECGAKRFYGETEKLGFNLCGYVATGPSTKALVALDTDRRRGRSEPTLHFDERTKQLQIESMQASPTPAWTVKIGITDTSR